VLEGIDLCDRAAKERLDVIGVCVAEDHEDAFRWRAREVRGGLEIAILGDNCVAVCSRPRPDGVVGHPFERHLRYVRGVSKAITETADERAREILIEQQPQAVAARSRICSAA